jgi:hypothetical protein
MKYAVEMGSSHMIYMPNFVKISSDIKKFLRGDTQKHTDRIVNVDQSKLQPKHIVMLLSTIKLWYSF